MKGIRLKKLREDMRLKQDELAKALSISPSAIGMYERDEREPNDELTLRIADFFNVSTDYLLGKTDVKNQKTLSLSDEDVKFIKNIKKLTETEKKIIRDTMEAFLDKQEKDEKNGGK